MSFPFEILRRRGIDLDEILGDYKSFLATEGFTSFKHIVRNLMNEVTPTNPSRYPKHKEMIERKKQDLIKYIELIREFPEFREEHFKQVDMKSPLGQGSTSAYVNQMYEKLKGKYSE